MDVFRWASLSRSHLVRQPVVLSAQLRCSRQCKLQEKGSDFSSNFRISPKFHNFAKISEFCRHFRILLKFQNFSEISDFHRNFLDFLQICLVLALFFCSCQHQLQNQAFSHHYKARIDFSFVNQLLCIPASKTHGRRKSLEISLGHRPLSPSLSGLGKSWASGMDFPIPPSS